MSTYPYPGPRVTGSVVMIDDSLTPIKLYPRGPLRFGLTPDGPFQEPEFAPRYCPPLLSYGALASPPSLISRFGPLAVGTIILPCTLVDGVETAWATGGRYTLVEAERLSAEAAWLVLFPLDFDLAVTLDLVEGRPLYYNSARLDRGAVAIDGQPRLDRPITFIGAVRRQPVELHHQVAPHTIIPADVLLADIEPSAVEAGIIAWVTGRLA